MKARLSSTFPSKIYNYNYYHDVRLLNIGFAYIQSIISINVYI